MVIRTYKNKDRDRVIDLWKQCSLISPGNNPVKDIKRKSEDSPDLFFVGESGNGIIATCMAGYDGHRGWIYYLAVKREHRKKGIGSKIIKHAEKALKAMGCPKIDLMVRKSNKNVISFYNKTGYKDDPVVVLSKRLINDDDNDC